MKKQCSTHSGKRFEQKCSVFHSLCSLVLLCLFCTLVQNSAIADTRDRDGVIKPKPLTTKMRPAPMPTFFGPCPACPTDAPPTNIPWTSFSVDTWIGTCYCRICYCTRETSPGNHDFTITEIQHDGGDCDDIATLVNDAYNFLKDNNPMEFPCPPCDPPGYENNWREVRGSCWHNVLADPVPFVTTCEPHFWCMTPFRVCCDENGVRHYIQGATVVFGDPNIICNSAEGCVFVSCP